MDFKKGDLLLVNHSRKGTFNGVVTEDFNINDEWYYISMAKDNPAVVGLSGVWEPGDNVICGKKHTKIKHIESPK